MQQIRAAVTRGTSTLNSLRFERVAGNRSHQHSMASERPVALMWSPRGDRATKVVVIVGIEITTEGDGHMTYEGLLRFPSGRFHQEELRHATGVRRSWPRSSGGTPGDLRSRYGKGGSKRRNWPRPLGDAFGTCAQYWMNRESAYQLGVQRMLTTPSRAAARLYGLAPIKGMGQAALA